MAQTFFFDAKRDDGSPVTVEFSVEDSGVDYLVSCIWSAWRTDTEESVKLTDAEGERIDAEIAASWQPDY